MPTRTYDYDNWDDFQAKLDKLFANPDASFTAEADPEKRLFQIVVRRK